MKFDPRDKLSNKDAHAIIREIVACGGEIILSSHVKDRMKERKYSMHDIEYILCNGKITKKDFNEERQNWTYVISGDDLEGDSGAVVIAILKINRALIITVLS